MSAARLQKIRDTVAATPGASWRPEEILFRFGDDPATGKAVIVGGHVTVIVRMPEADGDIRSKAFGPYPIPTLADDPLTKSLLGEVRLAQQRTIDRQAAQLAAVTVERDALAGELTTARAERDRLAERVAALTPGGEPTGDPR
jgi:hypothetical protein